VDEWKPFRHGRVPQLYSAVASVNLSMGVLTRLLYSYPAGPYTRSLFSST
jgi:hypothetical protein